MNRGMPNLLLISIFESEKLFWFGLQFELLKFFLFIQSRIVLVDVSCIFGSEIVLVERLDKLIEVFESLSVTDAMTVKANLEAATPHLKAISPELLEMLKKENIVFLN